MVASAGANWPGDKRILVVRIIANEQNRLPLVQLLHGEQGIFGVFAERCKEAGVIGGAVVIDVVCAEGDAGEAVEEIVFFVRSAVRTDEADGIGAMQVADDL